VRGAAAIAARLYKHDVGVQTVAALGDGDDRGGDDAVMAQRWRSDGAAMDAMIAQVLAARPLLRRRTT